MKGKNGILLFVEFLKGLLEDRNSLIEEPEGKGIQRSVDRKSFYWRVV